MYAEFNSIIALQKHGRDWKAANKELPARTLLQIRAHAQKFFIKISRIKPKHVDMISYIKSIPADSLLDIPRRNLRTNSAYPRPIIQ